MYRFIKIHSNHLKLTCRKYCFHGLEENGKSEITVWVVCSTLSDDLRIFTFSYRFSLGPLTMWEFARLGSSYLQQGSQQKLYSAGFHGTTHQWNSTYQQLYTSGEKILGFPPPSVWKFTVFIALFWIYLTDTPFKVTQSLASRIVLQFTKKKCLVGGKLDYLVN